MYFGFDDDQLAVRDTVGALLDDRCPLAAVEQAWEEGGSTSLRGVWGELAALGVQGLLAPESSGGSGLGDVTLALILAETGRVALPLPIMETAAVGVPMVMAAGDPDGVLAQLIDGSLVLTVATGSLCPAATLADLFIIDGPSGAVLYRRDSVDVEPVASVDRTRDLARVRPRSGPSAGSGTPLNGFAFDRAALATAAQLIGLGREMVRMTVEHVKPRRQFSVPIGSIQALKHHLADATLRMEFAAPTVWAASLALSEASEEQTRSISLAKATASDAAYAAGRVALQCHGAMGYTDEYRLHLWMKRAWCLAAAHGSAAWHRDRIGRELGL